MNENYWKKFYLKKGAPTEPSDFAKFITKELTYCGKDFDSILELGAGNCRDSIFLAKELKKSVFAVDRDITPFKSNNLLTPIKCDVKDILPFVSRFNFIYSRFFLHSISNEEIIPILNYVKNGTWFAAEFRAKGDKPKIYADHDRNFIDSNWIIEILKTTGFDLKFFMKGRGLAVYKGEDPLVIRIIAYKK